MAISRLLVALLASTVASAHISPQHGRNETVQIIGGVPAQIGDFPFIVSVQFKDGRHFCAGSLINANTVLTAGHCVYAIVGYGFNASDLAIRAGSLRASSGGVTAGILSMHINPNFSTMRQLDYDVAILKLSSSLPEDKSIHYASLAANGSDPAAETMVTAAGWGFTKNWGTKPSEILDKVSLPVVSRKSCESRYRDLDLFGIPENITENMFCAGYIEDGDVPNDKDTCQGDSGGPIVDPETGNVVGIISWGSPACGANSYLGVNARVGSLRSFINKYLS